MSRITLPSGRTYDIAPNLRRPDLTGPWRLVDAGDAANSSAPVYRPLVAAK